eukprot:5120530-Amphidinium_carterae.1
MIATLLCRGVVGVSKKFMCFCGPYCNKTCRVPGVLCKEQEAQAVESKEQKKREPQIRVDEPGRKRSDGGMSMSNESTHASIESAIRRDACM